MTVRVAITNEVGGESRVAATPQSVQKLVGLGAQVAVQSGVGAQASIPDASFAAVGAEIAHSAEHAIDGANVLFKVGHPTARDIKALRSGVVVVAAQFPKAGEAGLRDLAQSGATAFAMDLIPRITRSESMDVLSSQASLAGYRAVIEAAQAYGRVVSTMTSAAGVVGAANVFVVGAGVAGLQAIATARQLGAVVTATDVRAAKKLQVESLGAKFVAIDGFQENQAVGGLANAFCEESQTKLTALITEHIREQDIVITTAHAPGRAPPCLITADQVALMRPGSVIVDLATGQVGNVQFHGSLPEISVNGVKVLRIANLAGRVPADASALYASNLVAFAGLFLEAGVVHLDLTDEILKACLVVHAGQIMHPSLRPPRASEVAAA